MDGYRQITLGILVPDRHLRSHMVIPANWIVYILRCADGTLYTGITNNLERRVAEHEAGQGARYTKGRGPLKLVYQEICQGRGLASKREGQIKSLTKKGKLLLVAQQNSGGRFS